MSTINPTLHIPYYTSDKPVVRYTESIDSGVVYTDTNNNIQGGKLTFTEDYFNINSNRTSIVCFDNKNNNVFNSFDLPTSTLEALHTGSANLTLHSVTGYYATVNLVEYSMTITGISYNNSNNKYTINYTISKGGKSNTGHITESTDNNGKISFAVTVDKNSTNVTISNIHRENNIYYFDMTVNSIYKNNCTVNQQYDFYSNSYFISNLSYNSTSKKYTFDIQYNSGETFNQTDYTNNENIVVNNTLISLNFTTTNNTPSSVTIILYKTGQATTTISYTLQYNPITNTHSWLNMDNINASNYITKSFDTEEFTNTNIVDNVSITSNYIYVVGGNITSIQFIDNTLNYNVNKKYIALLDIDVIYNDISVMSDLVKSSNYLFLTFNTNSQGKINNTGTGTYDNIISDYKSLEKYTENITTTTSKVFHVSKVITDLYFNDYPCYFYISLFKFNTKIYENITNFFDTNTNYSSVSLLNTDTFSQNIRLVGSVTIMEYIK